MSNQTQYLTFSLISLIVAISTAWLYAANKTIYSPFLGSLHPVFAILLLAVLGLLAFVILLSRGWLAVIQPYFLRGLLTAGGLALLFGAIIILIDLKVILPDDLNRPFPQSLLFYPTIGYVVEIVFHVLPLTLLLLAATALFKNLTYSQIIWPAIVIVALLEPAFQTAFGFSRPYPTWVTIIIALHIFLLNLCQLILFKRYDFVSMYTFRLVYYLIWHILWGVLRLRLLF